MKKLSILCLCALLACAPVLSLADQPSDLSWNELMGKALTTVDALSAPNGTLTVQASSAITVVPDTAQITFGMSVVSPVLATAQSEANTVVNAIVDALKALGIDATKIVTSSYNISPQRDYSTGDGSNIVGYYVSNSVSVTLDDFTLLDKAIDSAIAAGANEVYGINFDTQKRSEYYRQALVAAVEAGQIKADLLAEATGVEITALSAVTEISSVNDSLYLASNSADSFASAKGDATQIQGGELSVTAQIQLVYSYTPKVPAQ